MGLFGLGSRVEATACTLLQLHDYGRKPVLVLLIFAATVQARRKLDICLALSQTVGTLRNFGALCSCSMGWTLDSLDLPSRDVVVNDYLGWPLTPSDKICLRS